MALDGLVRYVSRLCADKALSLYTLADRHDWSSETVAEFLRGQKPPTDKMLREMARDLDASADYLKRRLEE